MNRIHAPVPQNVMEARDMQTDPGSFSFSALNCSGAATVLVPVMMSGHPLLDEAGEPTFCKYVIVLHDDLVGSLLAAPWEEAFRKPFSVVNFVWDKLGAEFTNFTDFQGVTVKAGDKSGVFYLLGSHKGLRKKDKYVPRPDRECFLKLKSSRDWDKKFGKWQLNIRIVGAATNCGERLREICGLVKNEEPIHLEGMACYGKHIFIGVYSSLTPDLKQALILRVSERSLFSSKGADAEWKKICLDLRDKFEHEKILRTFECGVRDLFVSMRRFWFYLVITSA